MEVRAVDVQEWFFQGMNLKREKYYINNYINKMAFQIDDNDYNMVSNPPFFHLELSK